MTFIHIYPCGTKCAMELDLSNNDFKLTPDNAITHCEMHEKYPEETHQWVDECYQLILPNLSEEQMTKIVARGIARVVELFEDENPPV